MALRAGAHLPPLGAPATPKGVHCVPGHLQLVRQELDVDFDGKPDLVVTNNHNNQVTLYRNTGGNLFAVTTLAVNTPGGVIAADINHDGKPDVWEIYDDGKLERRGVDLDFDGHVDRWDRDEIALREIEQKDEAAEKAAAAADAGPSASSGTGSGGAPATGARGR